MRILAIDTSCDDTASAVVLNGRKIVSNVVSSQIYLHRRYGGVVPELASRKHIEAIVPVVREALRNANLSLSGIDGIAVTHGPGLVGSLLVGLCFAKALSFSTGIPFVGVNHIEGHLSAIFLEPDPPGFPFVGLVVSGGHTVLYRVDGFGKYSCLGQTRDDAAGEAFDKVAKLLGLGYPGGPIIDRLSEGRNSSKIKFPRPYLGKDSFDFSFSGLKTSVVNFVRKWQQPGKPLQDELVRDIVSGFQEAVIEVLVKKTIDAACQEQIRDIVVSGGVASNRRLREKMEQEASARDIKVHFPSPSLCTDNAAMIGVIGYEYLSRGAISPYSLNAYASLRL